MFSGQAVSAVTKGGDAMTQNSTLTPEVLSILDRLPKIGDNSQTTPMLPRECYTSPEFFDFERKVVFTRSWICIGHQDQIQKPGDFLTPTVAAEPLIVVRRADGTIGAMSAVC